MANSGGGCIIFGIKDETQQLIGISSFEDESKLFNKIKKFIPIQLKYKLHSFDCETDTSSELRGKKFQALLIEDNPKYIPFISEKSSGGDIEEGKIYVRRGTNSEQGNYEEVQEIINRRIETNVSIRSELSLERHYRELRQLDEQLPKPGSTEAITENLSQLTADIYSSRIGGVRREERFFDFIRRMIEEKKHLIEFKLEDQEKY